MVPQISSTDKAKTLNKIDDYALRGYRTLVFGMKEITDVPEKELYQLNTQFVEEDFQLLGVTGVEDLLSEGVQDCIKDFQEAKINLWMLTGDKGETALEVGKSCGLFRDHFIYMIPENEENLAGRLD